MAPHTVQSTLNFFPSGDLAAPTEKAQAPPATQPAKDRGAVRLDIDSLLGDSDKDKKSAKKNDPRTVTITDVAGEEDRFNLDDHGFQYAKHTSVEKEFIDHDGIRANHYPEIIAFVKEKTGASSAHIQSHFMRRPTTDAAVHLAASQGPSFFIHNDHTPSAARASLQRSLPHLFPASEPPEQVASAHIQPEIVGPKMKHRWALINLWRPIKPIERDPLAIVDASTVRDEQLVASPLTFPNRREEFWMLKHSDEHRWYYKSGMGPDDVVMFKIFDSKTHGTARRTPHSAFEHPDQDMSLPQRESVELRIFLFWEDQPLDG